MPKPWNKFRVGKPSKRTNWTNPDCQPLTTVSHVAHVPTAARIVEDNRLRSDLVFDESVLNTKRVRVTWFSPNDWWGAGGFRYGNVRFTFDWVSLVDGKKYYWVENIAYGIPAARILVTDEDRSGVLLPYDPTSGDGPWWLDPNGEHHWNGDGLCLEIMFEGDMPISQAKKVDFVKHRSDQCNVDPRACRYRGMTEPKASAEFLGRLAARGSALNLPGFVDRTGTYPRPQHAAHAGASHLIDNCGRAWTSAGPLGHGHPAAADVARALAGAIARGASGESERLASLFETKKEVRRAVRGALADLLQLDEPEHLNEPA